MKKHWLVERAQEMKTDAHAFAKLDANRVELGDLAHGALESAMHRGDYFAAQETLDGWKEAKNLLLS